MNSERIRLSLIAIALFAPACGGSGSNPSTDMGGDLAVFALDSGARDQSISGDLATVDLAAPPDQSIARDLASPPDLEKAVDLSGGQGDLAGHPHCQADNGYFGMNGQCGQGGTCNGHVFSLDCDGKTCVCSIDKAPTSTYIEMMNSCNTLMADWTNVCQF